MSSRLEFVDNWELLAQRSGFRPSELAELCQSSLRTLERHFQRNYGLTVSQWLKDLRLKQSYDALRSGKSVKEVAYDHGYKQISHFSREFKNRFGISPSFITHAQNRGDGAVAYRRVSPTSGQMIFSF